MMFGCTVLARFSNEFGEAQAKTGSLRECDVLEVSNFSVKVLGRTDELALSVGLTAAALVETTGTTAEGRVDEELDGSILVPDEGIVNPITVGVPESYVGGRSHVDAVEGVGGGGRLRE